MLKNRRTFEKQNLFAPNVTFSVRVNSGADPKLQVLLNNLTAQINLEMGRLYNYIYELHSELFEVQEVPSDGVLTVASTNVLVDTGVVAAVTLPSAELAKFKVFTIKHSAGASDLVVSGVTGETIDGESSQTVYLHDAMKVTSNGTEWFII